MGVQVAKRERAIWGLSGPFDSISNHLGCSGRGSVAVAFAAIGIIQSPITSCSRRDHSVCQASVNSILKKFLGAGDAAYRPRRGGGIAQRGRSLISTIALFNVLLLASRICCILLNKQRDDDDV